MATPPKDSKSDSKSASPVRLDSWKEIAAYLGRGERTVKRWEAERALPIYRVPGGRGSVYAFAAELDEWLRSEREIPDGQEELQSAESPPADKSQYPAEADLPQQAPSKPSSSSKPVRLWILVSAVTVFVIVVTTLVWLRAKNSASVGAAPGANSERSVANDLYLRGRYEWNKRTPESLDRAIDLFTQAVVHDPSFAQAYAGLADTYNLRREFAGMPEKEAYERAIVAAKKAIELDDSLAEAHRSLAFALTYGELDFINGEKEYLRAIQLNPNDPTTHLWYANCYQATGWWDIPLAEIDRAQKLDPASSAILSDKGNMLFNAGRAEEGIKLLQQAERNDPQFQSPHSYLARIFLQTRNFTAYLEEAGKTASLTHDTVLQGHVDAARAGFARDGERGLLRGLYSAQKASLERGEIHPTVLALTCVLLGKQDEALALIEQDIKNHSSYAMWLDSLPALCALKDNPEYQRLVGELRRPPRR